MRLGKLMAAGVGASVLIVTPAAAVGIDELAKVILGGGSVLKKSEATCGTSAALTQKDSLAITFARAAAERALPISQFSLLDKAAEADATTQAQSATFCPETQKKKSGLLNAIKKAGKAILTAKMLGG